MHLLSKCAKVGDCHLWYGAIESKTGLAKGRVEGRIQKLIYYIWRSEGFELPIRGRLYNVCGNKNCLTRQHWTTSIPHKATLDTNKASLPTYKTTVDNLSIQEFISELGIECSYEEACKALYSVLRKMNKSVLVGHMEKVLHKTIDVTESVVTPTPASKVSSKPKM